jgi:hypothetical protein
LAAEVQAATDGQEESEFIRLVISDLLFGPLDLARAQQHVLHVPGVLILDCKALWDGLARSESSALGMKDKRVAIEALALKRTLEATDTQLSWVHSLAQWADCMTKDSPTGRDVFLKFAKTGIWRLVYDPKFESARKRAAKGLEILAAPPEPDNGQDADLREARDPEILEALRPSTVILEKNIPKGESNTRTTEPSEIEDSEKSQWHSKPRPEGARFETPVACSRSFRDRSQQRPTIRFQDSKRDRYA